MNLFSSVHWDTPRGVWSLYISPVISKHFSERMTKCYSASKRNSVLEREYWGIFKFVGWSWLWECSLTNVRNQLDTGAWAMGRDLDCHCCLDTQWSYRAAWVPSWRGTSFISTLDPDQYQIKRKKAAPFIFVVPRWVVIKNKYYRSSDKHFIIIISQQLSLKWNAYILLGST